ncbi:MULTISPECIES: amidohydrolase [unclassified Leeuwenhoekiella]|uniref:amidohydrolase n=1 Tax=unclassified Leeuwenhoekiella TaxID=2615029 RepID=UPI000C6535FD|nr:MULTISPECIES: amidohydrolase [unclassified Leeuwenhoekiella]MAW96116.1 amidohydrolase [Leeuwenhoekiella sp.]MBA80110.1 amidohydrolase [Leeuwenhoekiella sp.]|tara:strand:+ start:444 stop:1217 length:774 start_codon:yes stop_codon:yes gene_type:complete
MSQTLEIAAIQAHLAWENPIENRAYFDQKINELKQQVDLIILPEMFATGFSMSPQERADTGETLGWMKVQAAQTNSALAGSLMIEEDGKFFNRFYFVTPKGDITYYDKRHTFTLAGEHKVYARGKEKVIVNYKGWKLLLQICYDLRFPAFARNLEDYDALIYVANWPKKRIFAWDTLLKARAIENMSYCIGVNRVGLDGNGYEYNGYSGVYDSLGATVAFAEAKEQTIYAKLTKDHLEETRNQLNFLADRDSFSFDL